MKFVLGLVVLHHRGDIVKARPGERVFRLDDLEGKPDTEFLTLEV